MIMRPYGRHKAFKECNCIQCHSYKKSLKARKKSARQKAKKEIRNETATVGTKKDSV